MSTVEIVFFIIIETNSGHLGSPKGFFSKLITARLKSIAGLRKTNKKYAFTHPRCTYFPVLIVKIEGWVGGSARICTLCKLEKLYTKMDHPLKENELGKIFLNYVHVAVLNYVFYSGSWP